MKYLDYDKPNRNLHIFAPIFRQSVTNCEVSEQFEFTLDGEIWKGDNGRFFNITNRNKTTKVLQVNWKQAVCKTVLSLALTVC